MKIINEICLYVCKVFLASKIVLSPNIHTLPLLDPWDTRVAGPDRKEESKAQTAYVIPKSFCCTLAKRLSRGLAIVAATSGGIETTDADVKTLSGKEDR